MAAKRTKPAGAKASPGQQSMPFMPEAAMEAKMSNVIIAAMTPVIAIATAVIEMVPLVRKYLETGIAMHESAVRLYDISAKDLTQHVQTQGPIGETVAHELKEAPPEPKELAKVVDLDERRKEGARKRLRVLQDRLVKIIDEHEEQLAPSLKEMGCGGDCYECPNPEVDKYTGVEAQVRGCLSTVVNAFGLDPTLVRDPEG